MGRLQGRLPTFWDKEQKPDLLVEIETFDYDFYVFHRQTESKLIMVTVKIESNTL